MYTPVLENLKKYTHLNSIKNKFDKCFHFKKAFIYDANQT